MKKPLSREFWIRVLLLLLGLAIAHLGVTLFLLTELGSDPFNVLIQGLHRTAAIPWLSHGRIHLLVSVLIVLVLLVVDRHYIGVGTLLWGCVILAFGMTIVIRSEAGTGPNDLVAVVLSEKLRKPFGPTRVIVDLLFAGAGYLLGGTVGLGTLICAFVVGPAAQLFMPFSQRLVNTCVKGKS